MTKMRHHLMANEPFIKPRFVGARFDEHTIPLSGINDLGNLKDGWLEGRGIAPTPLNLERLSNAFVEAFPGGIHDPAVVPKQDGNVSLEWIKPAARVELEVNFTERRLELYATDIEAGTFVEEIFAMGDWKGASGKITALLG